MPRRSERLPKLPAKWVPGTATPCGWSFWSLWGQCKRTWFYKYYLGRRAFHVPRWLTTGTVYHALHEGITPTQIVAAGSPFSDELPEAKRLYDFRMQAGLPEATGHEALSVVKKGPLKGIYTAAVDRIERDGGREFKCLARVADTAEDDYKTHGEVVGELLASGLPKITVDIITKTKLPQIKTIEVFRDDPVTERKITVLERQVSGWWEELTDTVYTADKAGVREALEMPGPGPTSKLLGALDEWFPQQLGPDRCVGFGESCPYYDVCWANGEEQAARLFKIDPSTQRWRDYVMRK